VREERSRQIGATRGHLGVSFLREEEPSQKNETLCRRDEMHLRVTVYVVRAVTPHVRHVRRTRPSGSKWFFTRDTIKLVSSFFPLDVKRVALKFLALNRTTRLVYDNYRNKNTAARAKAKAKTSTPSSKFAPRRELGLGMDFMYHDDSLRFYHTYTFQNLFLFLNYRAKPADAFTSLIHVGSNLV